MNNFTLLLKVLLMFCTLFCYTNSYAICSEFQKSSQPQTFILAAWANTEGLKYTGQDANKMLNALNRHFSNTKNCMLKNANKADFDLALDDLFKSVQAKDTVFIFFSGHGKQLPEPAKNRDEKDCCDEALVFNGGQLKDDHFVKKVNKLKSKQIYVILDTCYAGGTQRADQACPAKSKRIKTASSLECGKCSTSRTPWTLKGVLFAATSEAFEAYEFGDGGWFSNIFAKKLNKIKPSGINAVETAFKQTKSEMAKKSKGKSCGQIPERLSR